MVVASHLNKSGLTLGWPSVGRTFRPFGVTFFEAP